MSSQFVTAPSLQQAPSVANRTFLRALTTLLRDAGQHLGKDHEALAHLDRAHALLLDTAPFHHPADDKVGGRQILAPWQASRVQKFIEANLETSIRIDDLIALTRLSASYFFRAFKGTFGMPPHAYISRLRIERAQVLLSTTDEQLCQIALAVGLADQAHLSRLFRQQTGCPPGVWRREMRGGLDRELICEAS